MDYGVQGNRKTLKGKGHPERNAQFEFINKNADVTPLAGQPVISVDTKKKELRRANPYGAYDLAINTAWVSVGTDHDTASYAVSTIQNGQVHIPGSQRIDVHGRWRWQQRVVRAFVEA